MVKSESRIAAGSVGYRFMKKFYGVYFNGRVIHILQSEKLRCKSDDDGM